MGDLLYETISPLGWDDQGQPIEVPEEAIAFRVRKYTNKPGRPPVVWTKAGPLHVGLDTSMEAFRKAVNNEIGSYRLYPVDRFGRELEPVAVIEVVPDDGDLGLDDEDSQALSVIGEHGIGPHGAGGGPGAMGPEVAQRFFDLYERMLTSRDAHDALLSNLLTTLVTTTATIQQSTAALLSTANTTVKVANGVEALERVTAPQLDAEGLADKLAVLGQLKESITALGDGGKSETPWFVQLLNGPAGMGLMTMANNFAQTIAAAQRAAQANQQAAPDASESAATTQE